MMVYGAGKSVAVTDAASSPKSPKNSTWLRVTVCPDFLSRSCTKEDCSLAHPPEGISVEGGVVVICHDFLRDRCSWENCKYYHPSQKLKEKMVEQLGNHLIKLNKLNPVSPPMASLISLAGPHSPVPASSPQLQIQQTPLTPSANLAPAYASYYYQIPSPIHPGCFSPRYRTDKTDRLEVCRDFLGGHCTRPQEECRFAHPGDHIIYDESDGTVIVCMDYMKGSCTRPRCKYLHPLTHLQEIVRSRQSTKYSSFPVCMPVYPSVPAYQVGYAPQVYQGMSPMAYPRGSPYYSYPASPLPSPFYSTSVSSYGGSPLWQAQPMQYVSDLEVAPSSSLTCMPAAEQGEDTEQLHPCSSISDLDSATLMERTTE